MWRAMIMSDYGSSLWRHGQLERGTAMLVEALPLLRALDNQYGGAWCFEQLAWAVVEQDPERAAVFLGAAEVLFTATGSPIETFQPLVAYHEQCVRRAREALGDNAFDAARQRGVAMNTEEVIAYALGEQPLDVAEPAADSGHNLTRREMQVAELVAEGMTNRLSPSASSSPRAPSRGTSTTSSPSSGSPRAPRSRRGWSRSAGEPAERVSRRGSAPRSGRSCGTGR